MKIKHIEHYITLHVAHIVCRGELHLINDNLIVGSGSINIDGENVQPVITSEKELIELGDYVMVYVPAISSVKSIEKVKSVSSEYYIFDTEGLNKINREWCNKIIVEPEHISLKISQSIADGTLKDGDEVLVECGYEMSEGWVPSYNDPDNAGMYPPSEPTGDFLISLNSLDCVNLLPIDSKLNPHRLEVGKQYWFKYIPFGTNKWEKMTITRFTIDGYPWGEGSGSSGIVAGELYEVSIKDPITDDQRWDDICEEFNVKVADKEQYFVTATQLFNWLKRNYKTPVKK